MLLAVPSVVAQVDGALTRSGQVGAYDGTRADFLTVAGKLSRYPRLSKAGKPLHYAPIVTTDSVPVSNNTATVYGNIVFNGGISAGKNVVISSGAKTTIQYMPNGQSAHTNISIQYTM